jgi:UDP-N-acetylmuramoylalanine--D-glutamate ligase
VAVLLNVTPDHLDRYDSFEAYAASKARLFAMQGDERVAIVDYRSEADEDVLLNAPENTFIQFIDDVNVLDRQADWPSLQGPHNLANAKAAVAVCRALELADPANAEGLRTFRGLPHRMERVEEISGVAYVNDSKGTNTAATAPALAAFGNIHWIVGGLAKEPGLGECEAQLSHVKAAYTIGSAGPEFAALLEPYVPVTRSETLDRAVRDADAAAEPGDTVLLSPACASFDQFADFEARGEAFRAAVKELAA